MATRSKTDKVLHRSSARALRLLGARNVSCQTTPQQLTNSNTTERNTRMKTATPIGALLIGATLITACTDDAKVPNRATSATNKPPAQTAQAQKTEEAKIDADAIFKGDASFAEKNSAKQVYQKLDPAELHIVFVAQMKSLGVDSDGNVLGVEGVVKTMAIGDTKIELISDKITLEGSEAWVNTKEYGKIKVTFNSNAEATLWVTTVQKKALLKLKK